MKAGGGTSSDSSWALSRENPCFPIMNMRIQHNMYKLEVKRSSGPDLKLAALWACLNSAFDAFFALFVVFY